MDPNEQKTPEKEQANTPELQPDSLSKILPKDRTVPAVPPKFDIADAGKVLDKAEMKKWIPHPLNQLKHFEIDAPNQYAERFPLSETLLLITFEYPANEQKATISVTFIILIYFTLVWLLGERRWEDGSEIRPGWPAVSPPWTALLRREEVVKT